MDGRLTSGPLCSIIDLVIFQVRNIEYKDPNEEEWEKFQKEIKEEASASAEIIAGEQEEATAERQIDEIDEQIRNWSRYETYIFGIILVLIPQNNDKHVNTLECPYSEVNTLIFCHCYQNCALQNKISKKLLLHTCTVPNTYMKQFFLFFSLYLLI